MSIYGDFLYFKDIKIHFQNVMPMKFITTNYALQGIVMFLRNFESDYFKCFQVKIT